MERIISHFAKSLRLGSVGMLPLFIPFLLTYFTSPVEEVAPVAETVVTSLSAIENSASIEAAQDAYFQENIQGMYEDMNLDSLNLNFEVFEEAVIGYMNLKGRQELSQKPVITIVDFEKPSVEKRLWVLNLQDREVLFHTYVAHGRGSGNDLATTFSNINESFMSSLGFYVTAGTYFGKHGLSLKLEGKDKNINCKALERNIVVHGAEYVSDEFIREHGRLGRSHGCPALPVEETAAIIEVIKDKTCLYLNGSAKDYVSEHLNPALARMQFFKENQKI
jgi:hypothetical protein